jgi:transposase
MSLGPFERADNAHGYHERVISMHIVGGVVGLPDDEKHGMWGCRPQCLTDYETYRAPSPMRPKGSSAFLEGRRRLAVRLLDEGRSVTDVAHLVGASVSSVRRWKSLAARQGSDALRAKPHPGPDRRLTKQQEEDLTRALRVGDDATGLRPADWSCSSVAAFIEARYGVVYHVDHVWRLLRRLGWFYWDARGWVYEPQDGTDVPPG